MATIKELKEKIDLHDLAQRLNLVQPKGSTNYRSPHHDDSKPSLSIFERDGRQAWKDWSSAEAAGDHVDLVCYVLDLDKSEAVRWLHETYGIPFDKPEQPAERRELSKAEYIGQTCQQHAQQAISYLESRGISREVIDRAIRRGSIGFNVWTSPKVSPGEQGHGGPAVAFLVRSLSDHRVVAVDLRYVDAELNGGQKTSTQGEKEQHPWYSDRGWLDKSRLVVLVESPINALSVETCGLAGAAAVAIRGVGNSGNVDLSWAIGKRVVIAMDHDQPNERTGQCPGAVAAWTLYDRLSALGVPAMLVDWSEWEEGINDLNDILQKDGAEVLKTRLQKLEPWVIPGMPGNTEHLRGKPRLYLPDYDFSKYWRFRAKWDFTTVISEKTDPETGEKRIESTDLCGFRVASIARVTIASAVATLTGEDDAQPNTVFAVSVQTPQHGNRLVRRVFDEESLFNIEAWKRFGAVFSPSNFLRMVTILARAADLAARDAANFVGLAWRRGRLTVNEGPDTFFVNPSQQCPYHNLIFPRGTKLDARRVLDAYIATSQHNAAALMLVWGLGAHLKALLGFWPHCTVQADKGAGKTTLLNRMERTLAFTVFSGQNLKSEFRILTSVSATSHPVAWDELSANGQRIIDVAMGILQENYQYRVSRRNSDMIEFLLSAPVLLAGESVQEPARTIIGKTVRASLKEKGTLIPEDSPRFPLRQWLEFLATQSKESVRAVFRSKAETLKRACRATATDHGASRMVENYAAVATAWALLSQWIGVAEEHAGMPGSIIREMNEHIAETSSDREPWIWIVETLLAEIARGSFRAPYVVRRDDEGFFLLEVLPSHIMHHLKTEPGLRAVWDALPVKSDRVLKKQLRTAGVVHAEEVSFTTQTGRRQTHAIALDGHKLALFGLHVPEQLPSAFGGGQAA